GHIGFYGSSEEAAYEDRIGRIGRIVHDLGNKIVLRKAHLDLPFNELRPDQPRANITRKICYRNVLRFETAKKTHSCGSAGRQSIWRRSANSPPPARRRTPRPPRVYRHGASLPPISGERTSVNAILEA